MGFILRIFVPRTTITDLHMPADAIFEVVVPKHTVHTVPKHPRYLRYSTLNNFSFFLSFFLFFFKVCMVSSTIQLIERIDHCSERHRHRTNTPFSLLCHWEQRSRQIGAEGPGLFKKEEWWRKLFRKEQQCFFCHPRAGFLHAALSSRLAQVRHRHFRAGVKWQSKWFLHSCATPACICTLWIKSSLLIVETRNLLKASVSVYCIVWVLIFIAESAEEWSGKSFSGVIPLRHV